MSFAHAGGGDAMFLEHWHPSKRVVLPFDVLHLGRTDVNWFGCDQQGRDMMAKYCIENGWRGPARKHSPEAAARAGPIVERVQVPGYEPSSFQLPFVRRAHECGGRHAEAAQAENARASPARAEGISRAPGHEPTRAEIEAAKAAAAEAQERAAQAGQGRSTVAAATKSRRAGIVALRGRGVLRGLPASLNVHQPRLRSAGTGTYHGRSR